jgi:glycosyltransferase involved in cell wall biosynthesis
MPIPPTGWGAVEILVWDYAKALERQGHSVVILNDADLNKVVQEIRSIRPDVVHIQYDNHAHISGVITEYTKVIGITSHYGYLEQINRWGGYGHVFNGIITQRYKNLYHFVLSEGIANIYKMSGVDHNKIIVCPNGANEALFRFSETPEYPNIGLPRTRHRPAFPGYV